MSPAGGSTKKTVAVVVTLSHKTTYTADEETAFRHIRRYLGHYDKFVVIPEDHAARYPGFREKRFPGRYFGSGLAHTALLLSSEFWQAFRDYEYVLIHHLDALVFSDQLSQWCDAGYDYVGAPWLICADTPQIKESKVGNGGFSLRKVESALRVLNSQRYFVDPDEYWLRYAARTRGVWRVMNYPRKYLKRIRTLNNARWHIRWVLRDDVHEDRFWAEYATAYDPGFKIAPVDVAMRFAFEAAPRQCYATVGGLPFGCHRWQRFDRAFWSPFLLTEGPGSQVERLPEGGTRRRIGGHAVTPASGAVPACPARAQPQPTTSVHRIAATVMAVSASVFGVARWCALAALGKE